MACYQIPRSADRAAAKELLGETIGSFIITDCYARCHWLDTCNAAAAMTVVQADRSERSGAALG